MRPICTKCNKRKAEKYYYVSRTSKPNKAFRTLCEDCRRPNKPEPCRRRIPKTDCAMCAFVPLDACQMDLDHIDGNHKNNAPENLQILCSNCHRLKTKLNGDGIYKN